MNDNWKNWLVAAAMAAMGYFYTQNVIMQSDVQFAKSEVVVMRREASRALVDHENRMRVLEMAACGDIGPTQLDPGR